MCSLQQQGGCCCPACFLRGDESRWRRCLCRGCVAVFAFISPALFAIPVCACELAVGATARYFRRWQSVGGRKALGFKVKLHSSPCRRLRESEKWIKMHLGRWSRAKCSYCAERADLQLGARAPGGMGGARGIILLFFTHLESQWRAQRTRWFLPWDPFFPRHQDPPASSGRLRLMLQHHEKPLTSTFLRSAKNHTLEPGEHWSGTCNCFSQKVSMYLYTRNHNT